MFSKHYLSVDWGGFGFNILQSLIGYQMFSLTYFHGVFIELGVWVTVEF